MTTKPIAIIGSSGHARVVADACRAAGRQVAGFVDPHIETGTAVGDVAILGGDELLDSPSFTSQYEVLVGIGGQKNRRLLGRKVESTGNVLATVVHPSAVLAPDVRIGAGTVIVAGAVINTGSVLGRLVIVNTGATIDHDNRLKDGVQICPGAHLAGNVTCEEDAFVGTGATAIPGITIGARAVVGAGAVVIDDVPQDTTVVGNPAKIVSR